MTSDDVRKRRSMIVRRWKAYRLSRVQREIWKKRRGSVGAIEEDDLDEIVGEDELLADMPEALLG